MGGQPGVQQVADIGSVAALWILVVVGDEPLEVRGVSRLGGGFGSVDKRADFFLRRGRAAAGGERQRERGSEPTQAGPRIAASSR
jgi:hypothetical protein